MKSLTLTLLCLALAAQAQPDLNEMTLVGQYVGEDYDNRFGTATAMGDFDDDGFCEFIIGAGWWNEHRGKNYFYDWDGGWPTAPAWTVQGDSSQKKYDMVDHNVGDINGDGIEDFGLIYDDYPDQTRLDMLCGAADFDSVADWNMWSGEDTRIGLGLDSLGDVNGDGGKDFILGAIQYGYGGQARIYLGGTALDSIYDWRYLGYTAFDGLGDVNGDGYNDVILLGGQYSPVLLFIGGAPMDTIPDLIFLDYSYDDVAAIGDVNNDGFNDFSVLCFPQSSGQGRAVYFGGVDVDTVRDVFLVDEWGDPTYAFGFVTTGDVNGDGISDLITGDANLAGCAAYVYLGGPWFNGVPDAVMQGVASYYNWGEEISVGDVNGDGRDEVLVASSNYWFEVGLAQLFTGPPSWIDYGAAVEPGDLSHTPGWYKLEQNYPNPFNSTTSIHFEIGKPSTVNLTIYDLKGAKINHLIVNKQMLPGGYNVSWSGKNEQNQQVSSGIYLLELQVDQYRQLRKIALLR